jgi:hypothetical protein
MLTHFTNQAGESVWVSLLHIRHLRKFDAGVTDVFYGAGNSEFLRVRGTLTDVALQIRDDAAKRVAAQNLT